MPIRVETDYGHRDLAWTFTGMVLTRSNGGITKLAATLPIGATVDIRA